VDDVRRASGGSAIAASVTAASAPATSTAAGSPLARLAHRERPAAERLPVQRGHGRLRLGVGRHLDESEPAWPTGLPVGDDLDLLDLSTVLLECTVAGMATCTLTHLIESEESRDIVRNLIGHGEPQVLIRAGIAPPLEAIPAPTPRRPLDGVLEFR